jgi:hypothetical protein
VVVVVAVVVTLGVLEERDVGLHVLPGGSQVVDVEPLQRHRPVEPALQLVPPIVIHEPAQRIDAAR